MGKTKYIRFRNQVNHVIINSFLCFRFSYRKHKSFIKVLIFTEVVLWKSHILYKTV